MREHWLFIWNVGAHLVASMSGVASFAFAMWEHTRKRVIESRVFFIVGALCLVVAFEWNAGQKLYNLSATQRSLSTLSDEVLQLSNPKQKTKPILFDSAADHQRYLLITNKRVGSASFIVRCGQPISMVRLAPFEYSANFETDRQSKSIDSKSWQTETVHYPDWAPDSPYTIGVEYVKNPFRLQGPCDIELR